MKSISIIVPSYNDDGFLKEKLRNLLMLKYVSFYVEIIFAYGGASKDSIATLQESNPLIRAVKTTKANKIYQINKAIEIAHGDYILITDVDAYLDEHCLWDIVKEFEKDANIGVVGLWNRLIGGTFIDRCYWYIANIIRLLEYKFYSSSHVVAPGYAVRKELATFPEDVIADDFYISLHALFSGYRVAYIKTARSYEIRSPLTRKSFFRHKMRKGNACLRELLRFLYRIYNLNTKSAIIYFARLIQFTMITPLILIYYPFTKQDACYEKCNISTIDINK